MMYRLIHINRSHYPQLTNNKQQYVHAICRGFNIHFAVDDKQVTIHILMSRNNENMVRNYKFQTLQRDTNLKPLPSIELPGEG